MNSAPPPVLHVPVAVGEPRAITTENTYSGFPDVAKDSTNRTWMSYRSGSNHAGPDGQVRVRFRDPGKAWSTPTTVAAPTSTHMFGTGGLVADAVEDGGRLWLGLLKAHSTGASTADDYTAHVIWRDPATGAWSAPMPLPTIAPGQTIMTGLYLHDGELLATAYGRPAGAPQSVARVFAFNRSAATWSVRGTVAIPGRPATEPTLVTLADGRLLMLIRSDLSSPWYCYVFSATSSDAGATWTVPSMTSRVAQHATGLPAPYRLPSGEVAFTYRGFSEPKNPATHYPMRIGMLNPDGTPQQALTEQGHDVLSGDLRRFLYGGIVDGDTEGTSTAVFSLEVPGGGAATVYELTLGWPERSN